MLPRKVPEGADAKPSSSGGGGQLVQIQHQHQLDMVAEAPTSKRSRMTAPKHSPVFKFSDLPDEMLCNVFSYLSTKDKLNARLVCTHWNKKISTWGKFMETLVFPLTADSLFLFKHSRTGWRHTSTNFNSDDLSNFLPLTLKPETESSISTIKLANQTFNWSTAQELLTSFPQLNSITIENCKLEHEVAEGFFQTPEACRKANDLRTKLRSLSIKVSRFDDLLFFISVFRTVPLLKQLAIHHEFLSDTPGDSRDQFLRALTTMVKSCQFKLIDFSVTGTILFQRIIAQWLCELRMNKIRLDLVDLSLKSLSGSGPNNSLSALCIGSLMTFLKTQKNLQSLHLPPLNREYRIIYEQLEAVSPNIKSISLQSDWLLNTRFFDTFQNLQELQVKISRTMSGDEEEDDDDDVEEEEFFEVNVNNPNINNKLMESVQNKIFLNMKKLWVTSCSASTLVSISISFPNVTNLTMDGNSAITDEGLQEIIRNLINLESLTIGDCEALTDFGVSGLIEDYCSSHFRSRKIYLESLSFDKGMQIGHPISSLKKLKIFKCGLVQKITDVGLYYGFNFRNLRQIEMGFGEKVTLWGVLQLAKQNNYLERVELVTWGSLTRSFTTGEAKTVLRSTLPSILPKYIKVERGANLA